MAGVSDGLLDAVDEEVRRITDECYGEARRLLRENRDKLDAIVAQLLRARAWTNPRSTPPPASTGRPGNRPRSQRRRPWFRPKRQGRRRDGERNCPFLRSGVRVKTNATGRGEHLQLVGRRP